MESRRAFLKKLAAVPLIASFPNLLSACKGRDRTEELILSDDGRAQPAFEPAYVELHRKGELKKRGEELWERMRSCDICPRDCKINRIEGERGDCKASSRLEISTFGPHFGEERELVGRNGSGTVFFTNCSLLCVFCINYDVSQLGRGQPYEISELANMMLSLQRRGCHNINVVTPTHYAPHIILALDIATERGLRLPIVYNTHGWEKVDILKCLDGIVDIYLPDFKYGCPEKAPRFSLDAFNYVEVTQAAHLEIYRQVGTASVDERTGLMNRGLMIRHLVMPNDVGCTGKVMQWIGDNLPKDTYVNLMAQYTPMFKARNFPEINRRITRQEYAAAVESARMAGLTNVRVQGFF